jgi:hypothetical protein
MASLFHLLALILPITECVALPTLGGSPSSDAVPVSQYLNSFSIEFKDFRLFAGTSQYPLFKCRISHLTLGNATHPNQFSINLLSNLGKKTGVMPMIRVGGTTQYVSYTFPFPKF